MGRALELAGRGWGRVSPNPLVGAVVVRGDRVVGEGWHDGPGTPHAEVRALTGAGELARGATLYCTLEPCAHHGRTPPCTDAIVGAGVHRVVAAIPDPHAVVDGRGIAALESAGVRVEIGILRDEAERLNAPYLRHIRTGRPFVTLKMAATLDGKVAARDGSSRWITGEAARADVHRLRAGADALVVGAGTALADDPSLTVRFPGYAGTPVLRVVTDARGRVPATGHLFDDRAPTLVATTERAPAKRREEWASAGAEVLAFDETEAGLSLDALMATLGKRDVQGILLEGGPTLAWSAVAEGIVDRLVLYLAPLLAGGIAAAGILGGEGVGAIGDAHRLEIGTVVRMGDDLKVEGRVHRDR
jgi:diaminohydroxyphosphoribosylaminopyrimidine deaminase / 5-amino-6-(5-phosphoribosylamino)uracil reductase